MPVETATETRANQWTGMGPLGEDRFAAADSVYATAARRSRMREPKASFVATRVAHIDRLQASVCMEAV